MARTKALAAMCLQSRASRYRSGQIVTMDSDVAALPGLTVENWAEIAKPMIRTTSRVSDRSRVRAAGHIAAALPNRSIDRGLWHRRTRRRTGEAKSLFLDRTAGISDPKEELMSVHCTRWSAGTLAGMNDGNR